MVYVCIELSYTRGANKRCAQRCKALSEVTPEEPINGVLNDARQRPLIYVLFMNYLCKISSDFPIQCFDCVILEIGFVRFSATVSGK